MLKFKNITGARLDVFRPAELGGSGVDDGGVVEVDGTVTEELADAYLVGEGTSARAWPKSQWELVKESTAKSAKADKEN